MATSGTTTRTSPVSPGGPAGWPSRMGRLGAWRSLVARTVRVGEVPGSNPGAPISAACRRRAKRSAEQHHPERVDPDHRHHGEAEAEVLAADVLVLHLVSLLVSIQGERP